MPSRKMMIDRTQAICGGFFLPVPFVKDSNAIRARTAAKMAAVIGCIIWAASSSALVSIGFTRLFLLIFGQKRDLCGSFWLSGCPVRVPFRRWQGHAERVIPPQ